MEKNNYYFKVASPEYILQADKVFNEELGKQISGTLKEGHTYQLGYPGEILQSAGFPDNKIELLANHLTKKSLQENHPFKLNDLKGLVSSLNHPLAVFVYGAKSKAQNVIIQQEREGKKFLVGVHFNQEHRGTLVSDIRGIFPRDNVEWLNWIQQGKLLYVDKEKIQNIIAEQRTNPAEVSYLDLDFVAKVIKNFENPKFSMENVMIMEDFFDESKNHLATYSDSLQAREWQEKLARAGIEVGSRFRIERLCDFNDMKVKSIDLEKGKMTFYHPTTHPDYKGEFDWSIDRVLENIRLSQGSRWVQVDDDRHDIVIPDAEKAIMERAKDPSPRAAFTDTQVKALDRYCTLYCDKSTKESILTGLIDFMRSDFREARIPDGWIKDVRDEVVGLAHGERRESAQGVRR